MCTRLIRELASTQGQTAPTLHIPGIWQMADTSLCPPAWGEHRFSLNFTQLTPKVQSLTYSTSQTALSFQMGSGRIFSRAVQSTLITYCLDTIPPPTMTITLKSWVTWSSRYRPSPRTRLSVLLVTGVLHRTRPFELQSLLSLTDQGSLLGMVKPSSISLGQHISTSTRVSSLSIVPSSIRWGHTMMLNSQTCMNSSTCARVIWITSGQPSFIPVEERHPLLLTRRVKHAIDGTKVCAPWRTLWVAGCMHATSVKKRVTRGLTAPLRLSFESIGDYTLWHSLSFNFGSQYLFFLSPRCTLGATKK